MNHYFLAIRLVKLKVVTINVGNDMEQQKVSYFAGRGTNLWTID